MAQHIALIDVFASLSDPRQPGKVQHDMVETLIVAVCGILAGADNFIEIELWAEQRLEWFRRYLKLEQGIASHDTFGRLFSLIDPLEFESAFCQWVQSILPAFSPQVVAVDGKVSRRSGSAKKHPLHLVSAFAAQAGVVLGQRATAEKSNEKTAIPELLATLALEGCTVTIDAMGTHAHIAGAIRARGAEYVLAVKDNQSILNDSVKDFFEAFCQAPERTPHAYSEQIGKEHGRLEIRRCYVFTQLECLHQYERWPDLQAFVVLQTEREVKGKVRHEQRHYITSLPPDAECISQAIREHWSVENRLHWCMDVAFADDQMRARTGHAAHNLSTLKQLTMNLIRLDPIKRRGGIKARRLIASTSEDYMAELLGLT